MSDAVNVRIARKTRSATLSAEFPLTDTLRILDANLNRTLEGLRVVEDYLRFVLENRQLTELCKQIRHELVSSLGYLDMRQLHRARDTIDDIGVRVTTGQEYERNSLTSVVSASLNRVQQSLRCLEEYLKLDNTSAARIVEQLRYRTYTLEKVISVHGAASEKLRDVRLYVLVDGMDSVGQFADRIAGLLESGVNMIQLRDKSLSDGELLQRGRVLRDRCCPVGTLLVMNDRPDIARCIGADGVHLGQDDLPVKEARRIVGSDALIGVSTHSLSQARQAVVAGADYIGVGPVFPSCTKQFDEFPGLELLRAVAGEISLPAFAIGGIHDQNLAEVLAGGFTRIAVSGVVTQASDPAGKVRILRSLLTKNRPSYGKIH